MYKSFQPAAFWNTIFFAEANNNSKLYEVLYRLSALPLAEENADVMRKGYTWNTKNVIDYVTINGKKNLRSDYVES